MLTLPGSSWFKQQMETYARLNELILYAIQNNMSNVWLDKDFDFDVHCRMYPRALAVLKYSDANQSNMRIAFDVMELTCYGHKVPEELTQKLEKAYEASHQ